MIRVVTETLDEETGGHHPERATSAVLAEVLANEPAVTPGEALAAATDRQFRRRRDVQPSPSRHPHPRRADPRHRAPSQGRPRPTGQPEAWRLIEATERATERGLDPAAILAEAPDEQLADIGAAAGLLFRARLDASTQRVAYPVLVANLVPAAPPAMQPDVAAYLDGLAAGIDRRRDALSAEYQQGPVPTWTATLGRPPSDPPTRARWADAVAAVGVWREAHGISGDDPLGPPFPPGHRNGVARARAAMSAAEAVELATGTRTDKTLHLRDGGRDHLVPDLTPTLVPDQARRLGR